MSDTELKTLPTGEVVAFEITDKKTEIKRPQANWRCAQSGSVAGVVYTKHGIVAFWTSSCNEWTELQFPIGEDLFMRSALSNERRFDGDIVVQLAGEFAEAMVSALKEAGAK